MYERKTNVEQLRTNRGWRAVAKERQRMKRKIKCGDNPWKNSWHVRMNAKEPKYYCANCGKRFYTGRFSRKDPKIYDDVCPNCGAIGMTFPELIDTYEEMMSQLKEIK